MLQSSKTVGNQMTIDDNAKVAAWLQGIEEVQEQYADAKSQRVFLEEFKKSMLAMMCIEAERSDPVRYKTSASQEIFARAHPKYQSLLSDLQSAVYREESLKADLTNRRWKFEEWKTALAYEAAQMRRYGMVS